MLSTTILKETRPMNPNKALWEKGDFTRSAATAADQATLPASGA